MPSNHISPSIAQFAALECERLKKVNADLATALEKLIVVCARSKGRHYTHFSEPVALARAALARSKEQS